MSKSDFIEVPPPLYKYRGEDNIHDDNKRVMEAYYQSRKTILNKRQLAKLENRLGKVIRSLDKQNAAQRIEEYESILQDYNSAKLRLENIRQYDETLPIDHSGRGRLVLAARRVNRALEHYRQQLTALRDELLPLRQLVQQRNAITQKLEAHHTAVAEAAKEAELLKLMKREAEIIAGQLTRTLARIGFSHTETRGNKSHTYYVEWDHVVTTPDQHQFKIAASRRGIAGGSIDLLPNGVRVTDILQDYVMRELSVALEREVWSPHINEDVTHTNGAWIVVERLGLYEGIPKTVTFKQLMARYETAKHERFPIPAGLKKGRRINWVYLDSHASTHIMFTGITGSGKTNAIQASISALVSRQSPRDVLFAFIDLKNQGDFNELADAPHILKVGDKPIITEIPDVVTLLKQIRDEMHWRQKRIGKVAKNINAYNKRVREADRLPRIVILFDEYANTRRGRFAEQTAVIDDICTEITQVGRAGGVHLWLGIQQPRSSNMPQALRDNFTTMFIGHQANIGAGQSVTGNRASLKLPDLPGRMLAYHGWKSFEVQMPLISEGDIDEAVKTANEAYGDLPLYELHALSPSEAPGEPLTDKEVIIQTAFDEFGGALKIYPLHGILKDHMSRGTIKKVVDNLADEEIITLQGEKYRVVKKPGNYYQMEPVADNGPGNR